MKVASRPSLRRMLSIDRMLRANEYPNARTAARILEVSSRTVQRDLDSLRDSWGAPLVFSHERNGYFYSSPDYALPLLRLTEGELVALFLAERLLHQYRDTPYASCIATAFQKLLAALPNEVTCRFGAPRRDLVHPSTEATASRHRRVPSSCSCGPAWPPARTSVLDCIP